MLSFAMSPHLAAAQSGILEGAVRDATHAVVPDAAISLIQEESGYRFSISTRETGDFRVVVPAGHYKLVIRHDGFLPVSRSAVAVPAGGVQRLEFELQTESVFESITVSDKIDEPVAGMHQANPETGVYTLRPEDFRGLPQNDRTVMGMLQLTPGALATPANGGEAGQLSSFGGRPNANVFTVDGMNANNAVGGAGWPSYFPGATLPAMTALGTTHGLAIQDSIEEVEIAPQAYSAASGSRPGASVQIRTRSGGNQLHGSLFASGRPSLLGANDWFANRYNLGRNSPSLSDGGATLGGPIRRGRTFFFAAVERMRLVQSYAWTTTVPSDQARDLAPASVRPLMNLFPHANGPALSFGIAQFVGNKVRVANLSAVNTRLDHDFSPGRRGFLRLNLTPSSSDLGFLQSNNSAYWNGSALAGLTQSTGTWTQDTRLSFSRTQVTASFGSSAPEFYSQFPSQAADFSILSVGGAGSVAQGVGGRNRQDQMELSHVAGFATGSHQIRLGVDYMLLTAVRGGPTSSLDVTFGTPTDLLFGPPAPIWQTYSEVQTSTSRLHLLTGFAQDTWRITPRFTATLGLRWMLPRAPRIVPNAGLYSVTPSSTAINFTEATSGSPIWRNQTLLLDPRLSIAWLASERHGSVLRASWGTFHDPYFAVGMDQINGSPQRSLRTLVGFDPLPLPSVPVRLGFGFASNLRVPVYQRWDVSWEQSGDRWGALTVSYSGMVSNSLLRRQTSSAIVAPLGQLTWSGNTGSSSYHGMTATYQRRFAHGFSGSLSYIWSHAIDTGSRDSGVFLTLPGQSPNLDRGNSSFDVRHSLTGTFTWTTPGAPGLSRFTRGWTIGAIVHARTGFPIDVALSETHDGLSLANATRPNFSGAAVWTPDPSSAQGVRLNPNAFSTPLAGYGNLGRNAIRGFGMWQADVALERGFALGNDFRLTFRAEAYNVFNHAQFADPVRFLSNPMFGMSGSPLSLMMGSGSATSGQAPAFQMGAPRSMQGMLRLSF